jgi:hypothetical protein
MGIAINPLSRHSTIKASDINVSVNAEILFSVPMDFA